MNRAIHRLKKRASHSRDSYVSETDRVTRLAVRSTNTHDLTEELRIPGGTLCLRPEQSDALEQIREHGGGFFPIGVGFGKSFIALLAGQVLGKERTLVLAPASTLSTLKDTELLLSEHFRVPPMRVLSFASLSRVGGSDLLEEYKPDLIVADEAHKLKHLSSVRTRRIIRYFRDNPDTAFVALSGTMTSKRIEDFSHLAELALRDKSPVPRDRHHLNAWSNCIDVDGQPSHRDWRLVSALSEWAGLGELRGPERQKRARQAFRKRLETCPGVVCTRESSIGNSLLLHHIRDIEIPDVVTQALQTVSTGMDPDGNVLEDDVAAWRAARQVSCGYYYRWVWPGGVPDFDWLEARNKWRRYVSKELESRAEYGYDSPLLVAQRISKEAEEGRRIIHRAWLGWAAQKHKDAPPVEAVWLDYYLVDKAIKWLHDNPGSIVWYESRAMEDALQKRGVLCFGAGHQPPNDGRSCAMSIRAHGIGKNLQAWSKQLVIEPPSSGEVWEQLLGRTHRSGQEADEVEVFVIQHTESFRRALKSAKEGAEYIEDATGNKQKLNFLTENENGNF